VSDEEVNVARNIRDNREGEDARGFSVRRKFETLYADELQHVDGVEGVLVSRNVIIPHVAVYNVPPETVERFLFYMKTKANRKGWVALNMLLDLADAVEAGRNQEAKNDSVDAEKQKRFVRTTGGKSYDMGLRE
jgi:hypothetical protein